MHTDQFEIRLAWVRHRFATSLESTISDAGGAADQRTDGNLRILEHVSQSYRQLHNICGIGPTVGFLATGDAARDAKAALIQAYLEQRKPTQNEVISLKKALAKLRQVAASELRVMYQRGG